MRDTSLRGEFLAFIDGWYRAHPPRHGILVDVSGEDCSTWNMVSDRNWFAIIIDLERNELLKDRYKKYNLQTILIDKLVHPEGEWLSEELAYRCCPLNFDYLHAGESAVAGLLANSEFRPGLIMMPHKDEKDRISEWMGEYGYGVRFHNAVNGAWSLG